MTPVPSCSKLAQQRIDVEFCPYIDAARRLVEKQYARIAGDRSREHHFLLVAARKRAHLLMDARRSESDAPPRLGGARALGAAVEEKAKAT